MFCSQEHCLYAMMLLVNLYQAWSVIYASSPMHHASCITSVHATTDRSPTQALRKANSSDQVIYNSSLSCRDSQRRQRRARCCGLAKGAVPLQGSLQAALCPGGPGGCTDGGQSVQQPQSTAGHPGLLPHVCSALHQTPSACTCTGPLCICLLACLFAFSIACLLDQMFGQLLN